jgi:hypothetical protein
VARRWLLRIVVTCTLCFFLALQVIGANRWLLALALTAGALLLPAGLAALSLLLSPQWRRYRSKQKIADQIIAARRDDHGSPG